MSELRKATDVLSKSHTVGITDRSKMKITGVNDVSEFSDDMVRLKTVMGDMLIKGNSLSVGRINTETGEAEISGNLDMIQYRTKQKGGILSGLLR